jgi:hypothetical protein
MADLKFSQPERRNFLVPALIALAVLGAIFAVLYAVFPHRIADLSVTHTAILPTHTVFKSDSMVVGAHDQAQDDLYVLTTVHVDNKLKTVPLFIKDITGTLTTDDGDMNTTAVEKNDLSNLYITFPALKPLASPPLLREISIAPGGSAEGMVMLHFSVPQSAWDQRKSATVTVDFYHQGPFTVTIPKP